MAFVLYQEFSSHKSKPLNNSQNVKSSQNKIHTKYINLSPDAVVFKLPQILKNSMEGNHLKEGIVPAGSYDDQNCDWKKQEMISAFTLLSEKQKWMILTRTGMG